MLVVTVEEVSMSAVVKPQLAALRAQYGKITQAELSRFTGITQKQISALENGKTKAIEFETMVKLCRFFGCTLDDLFKIEEDYQPEPPLTAEELARAKEIVERALAKAKAAPPASPDEIWTQFEEAWDAIYQHLSKAEKDQIKSA